jgi:hypothetical protein
MLPAIYPLRLYVPDGGLITYGADTIDPYRRAAAYILEVDIPIRKDSNKQKVSRSLSFKSAPRSVSLIAVPAALRRAGGAKD